MFDRRHDSTAREDPVPRRGFARGRLRPQRSCASQKLVDHPNKGELAILMCVVDPIAGDENIGDSETDEIRIYNYLPAISACREAYR